MSDPTNPEPATPPKRTRTARSQSTKNATFSQSRPALDDHEGWKAYWAAQGQPWRTEPEIDENRRKLLARCRNIKPTIETNVYPFKAIDPPMTRADVEWLLATHESGGIHGPVNWDDPGQRQREGLDFRGVNLSGVDLTLLPLARLRGGLTLEEREHSTRSQRRMAAIRLEKALLSSTHLEGACLSRGHLEEVEATNAHLEQADLHVAYLEHANFQQAHLDGADLRRAFFDSASSLEDLSLGNSEYGGASLANVRWNGVNLTEVQWAYSVQAFGKRQFKTFILGDERRARQKKSHKGAIKTSARRLHEYRARVRANRQLAVELRNQGLTEEADHFAYRAQLLQRIVFRYEHQPLKYLFSWFLGLLTGYGYRMWRLFAYVLLNLAFATTYWSLGVQQPHDISFWTALIVSVTAFHGRVFSSPFTPNIADAQIIVTGIEAVAGLVIESLFVAMLVQKFFSR